MFGFNLIRKACETLAGSINAVAATFDRINAGLQTHVLADAVDADMQLLPAAAGQQEADTATAETAATNGTGKTRSRK